MMVKNKVCFGAGDFKAPEIKNENGNAIIIMMKKLMFIH